MPGIGLDTSHIFSSHRNEVATINYPHFTARKTEALKDKVIAHVTQLAGVQVAIWTEICLILLCSVYYMMEQMLARR